MKESTIETRLRKAVERAGGRCLKWVSPGHTGVPDRIILMPGGRVYFAETKAPGEKERVRQEYVQRKLRELGFKVFSSVDTFERVEEVMKELTEDQKLLDRITLLSKSELREAAMCIREHNQIHSRKEPRAIFITRYLDIAAAVLEKIADGEIALSEQEGQE